jgi:hypothetical protein
MNILKFPFIKWLWLGSLYEHDYRDDCITKYTFISFFHKVNKWNL